MTTTMNVEPSVEDVSALLGPDALSHDLLTHDEETLLAARMEVGAFAAHLLDTGKGTMFHDATEAELQWLVADGEQARQAFISSNLRLAFSEARKFRNRGFSDEDVLQDAYHGLVKAVDRFDHAKGFKFSTYAVWWIRESILTGLRASGFLLYPEVLWNQIIKVRAIRLRLISETGHPPTAEEIAAESARETEERGTRTGKAPKPLTVRDVQRCLREDRTISSLHTPLSDEMTLGEVISDAEAEHELTFVEDVLDHERLTVLLGKALDRLPAEDAVVLRARFGLDGRPPRVLNAIAEELGIARHTVRMRERRALMALRDPRFTQVLGSFLDSRH